MIVEAQADTHCDDKTLVARSIAGDQQAFTCLYERHLARVYTICLRLCGDQEETADITQDVFIHVWDKLDKYRGDSEFSTWLYRVATNVAISHIRKRKPFWARYIDWPSAANEEQMKTSAQHFEHHLDREILNLPEQARLVFVLFAIEGYRHEEIAKIMNIATGTSKAQYHRARQLLKEKLKHE